LQENNGAKKRIKRSFFILV